MPTYIFEGVVYPTTVSFEINVTGMEILASSYQTRVRVSEFSIHAPKVRLKVEETPLGLLELRGIMDYSVQVYLDSLGFREGHALQAEVGTVFIDGSDTPVHLDRGIKELSDIPLAVTYEELRLS